MEDKTFELISKMYADLTQRMDNMSTNLTQRLDNVQKEMQQGFVKFFDGYQQTYEKLTTLETKVDKLGSKIQKQDVEIRVIKNVATS